MRGLGDVIESAKMREKEPYATILYDLKACGGDCEEGVLRF